MGIPSYFSYIIKNHANIVRALSDTGRIHHLFMDCNSIIYDLFHSLVEKEVVDEDRLIQQVIDKIADYVKYIRPSKTLYIAFDGVAPLAKMDQQRTRRHKGLWMPPTSSAAASQKKEWSTCNITPGTPFMIKLSERVGTAFDPVSYGYSAGIDTVIVSAATECGEGEHKLFQHIRRESRRWTTTTKKEEKQKKKSVGPKTMPPCTVSIPISSCCRSFIASISRNYTCFAKRRNSSRVKFRSVTIRVIFSTLRTCRRRFYKKCAPIKAQGAPFMTMFSCVFYWVTISCRIFPL